MLFKLKLKGGALYIALIISIVIGIILSVFILIAYFNQRQVLARVALTQLRFDLKSGLNMATSSDFSNQNGNKWQTVSAINEDSLRIKKIQWGSYAVICVESKNRMHHLQEAGLYGIQAVIDTAILVADRSRPIGLGGEMKVNGACYFPKAGYKPVTIDGKSYGSDASLTEFMRQAPAQLPPVNTQLISSLKKCLAEIDPITDSLIRMLPNNLALDFFCKTALLQSGKLVLDNQKLSGNIKLVAEEVIIKKECSLDNILIVASKVKIESGFNGSLHIVAKDSIIVEQGCVLNYPSSLTVFNEESSGTLMKGIYLGADCVINGALVAFSTSADTPIIIKLNTGCEVYGLIYSGNYAHVQGRIFGTLFCEIPLITTPSSTYENTLLSCELDPKKFGTNLVVPSLFKTTTAYKCCKWL